MWYGVLGRFVPILSLFLSGFFSKQGREGSRLEEGAPAKRFHFLFGITSFDVISTFFSLLSFPCSASPFTFLHPRRSPNFQAGADYRFHLYRCISAAVHGLTRYMEGEESERQSPRAQYLDASRVHTSACHARAFALGLVRPLDVLHAASYDRKRDRE